MKMKKGIMTLIGAGLLGWMFFSILSGRTDPLYQDNDITENVTVAHIGDNSGFEELYPGLETGIVIVPEKYSFNGEITMEDLQRSENVEKEKITILNGPKNPKDPPAPLTWAIVPIRGEVKNIDIEERVITFSDIKMYIGEEADVLIAWGLNKAIPCEFSEIKVGDTVAITAKFQYGRGDPIYPEYLVVIR
jgi:predicted RNA-binding protein